MWNSRVEQSNNAILTATIYEGNLKDVNAIYLSTIAQGLTSFTESEKNTLLNIALQCPLTGGEGVYLARSLYSLVEDINFYDDNNCFLDGLSQNTQDGLKNIEDEEVFQTENGIDKVSQKKLTLTKNLYSIQPNPAKERLILNFLINDKTPKEFEIYDLLGSVIFSKTIKGQNSSFTVNVNNFREGIYFCSVKSADGIEYIERVIIVH